jgi:hypothetical protein
MVERVSSSSNSDFGRPDAAGFRLYFRQVTRMGDIQLAVVGPNLRVDGVMNFHG